MTFKCDHCGQIFDDEESLNRTFMWDSYRHNIVYPNGNSHSTACRNREEQEQFDAECKASKDSSDGYWMEW